MKKWTILGLVLLIAGAAVYFLSRGERGDEESPYTFGTVERGSLTETVSATGTLGALETVVVGTQVSGTVENVLVDFNDRVKQGQLLASIEKEQLDASRSDAVAQLKRAEAQLAEARAVLDQYRPLFEQGVVAKQDLLPRETAVTTAEANVQSARSVIARADKNRSNAEIRSPIDGIVINRSVEPGQTVAASFSTPSLFTLARDLGKMQILALVDESDIGQIRDGMEIRFTVAAYPEKTFAGTVTSLRLQPQTVQNVVSYTVVADAQNPEGVLLPGMTATVDFILSKIDDALLVPGAALRIKPTEEMQAAARKLREERAEERGERGGGERRERGGGERGGGERAGRDRGAPGEGGPGGPGASGGERGPRGGRNGGDLGPGMGRLWIDDGKGGVRPLMVKIGASDGSKTQVIPLREGELTEGMQVLTSVAGQGSGSGRQSNRFRPMGF
jgi:HlyD family secretion protein